MPNNLVLSFAKETEKSVEDVERKWNLAKKAALKTYSESDKAFYPTVTTILKKMLGIQEEDGEGGVSPVAATNTTASVGSGAVFANKMGATMTRLGAARKRKLLKEGSTLQLLFANIEQLEE
jgi:hypothetical protein